MISNAILWQGFHQLPAPSDPEPIRCARCGAPSYRQADRFNGVKWQTIRFSCCADLVMPSAEIVS